MTESPTTQLADDGSPAPAAALDPAVVAPDYHHGLHRAGTRRWKGVVAIVVLLVGYLGLSVVLSLAAMYVDVALGNTSMEDFRTGSMKVTPLMLLAVNLTAAALVPLSMLLQRWLFGVRGATLSSVRGMFRWSVLARTATIVVPLWLVYVGISMMVGVPGQPTSFSLDVSVPLLLVVLLTTWAQAAGEEYGFRGLITRSVGSWFVRPRTAFVVATVVANLLFMVAHFATDPWLIAYYFVFGVACSVVTWKTGGLEGGIVIHAVNNVFLFLTVALFMGGEVDMDRSVGAGGPIMLLPMGMMVLIAVLLSWQAHRRQLAAVESGL